MSTTKSSPLILVIDDDPDGLVTLKDLLEANDFRVLTAENGEAGISCAAKESPDMIIVDLCLPDMLGGEVFQRLRAQETTRETPVLAITAHLDEEFLGLARKAGLPRILSKPFAEAALLAEIHQSLKA